MMKKIFITVISLTISVCEQIHAMGIREFAMGKCTTVCDHSIDVLDFEKKNKCFKFCYSCLDKCIKDTKADQARGPKQAEAFYACGEKCALEVEKTI